METAHDLYDRAADAAAHIRGHADVAPKTAVVLGSGLAEAAAGLILEPKRLAFESIPNFPAPTAVGHEGELLVGTGPEGLPLAVLSGRIHLYEGYTVKSVTFPVRAMQLLGVETLLITNAAGAVNETYVAGDLMTVTDQINLTGEDPLEGRNDPRLGERFVDMSEPYDAGLLSVAQEVAPGLGIHLHLGVYAGVHGPTFETPAEIERLRRIGADAVGMSTVNEVIAARHGGMKVLGVSVITNVAGARLEDVAGEVLAASKRSAEDVRNLLAGIIARLAARS